MARVSYSKILAKFCGVNHFLNQISHGKVDAKCPCCPHPDETTEHIILCKNSARTRLYHDAVDKQGAVDDKSANRPAHNNHGIEISEGTEEADHVPVLRELTIAHFVGLGSCQSALSLGVA